LELRIMDDKSILKVVFFHSNQDGDQ